MTHLSIAYILTIIATLGLVATFKKQPTRLNKLLIQYSMLQLWIIQTSLILMLISLITNPVLLYIVAIAGGWVTGYDIVKVYNALVKDSLSKLHKR